MIFKRKPPHERVRKVINIIPFNYDGDIIWLEPCWTYKCYIAPIKDFPSKEEFYFNWVKGYMRDEE